MVEVPVTVACGRYDRTSAIRDGRVKVEGCAVTYLPLYPEEIFHRAFKFQEFDVSEISFSSYIRTVATGTSAYVGVPAFVSRIFRHSGIYVRKGAGISKPEDLRGKRIGVPEYQITAVVWMRGMMQHEYGVKPSEIHWHSGGQEEPGRHERTPLKPIPGLDLRPIGDDKTLVGMTGSSMPCSRPARRHLSGTARITSSCCFRIPGRQSRPTTRRPGCFRSCT
jgi:4,5-dihydroxyphthalate decarboxylase